jgi:hypothetical protein
MRKPSPSLLACLLAISTGCAGGVRPTRPPAPRPLVGQDTRGAERVRLDQMHAMAVQDATDRHPARPARELGALVSPDRPR